MTARILQGDCLNMLPKLPGESVHCVVTSPPYWSLRAYDGVKPSIWGGQAHCRHEWAEVVKPAANGLVQKPMKGKTLNGRSGTRRPTRSAFCSRCGAWRGPLGLEPSVGLYITHLVSVFGQVRRVLRPEGTLWIVIGDTCASGKGTCHNPGGGAASLGTHGAKKAASAYPLDRGSVASLREDGLKPKDACFIPFRLALALQEDKWWVRRPIVWVKGLSFCEGWSGSVMPESVRDRPTAAYDVILLCSKQKNPYYDWFAAREPGSSGESDLRKMREQRPRIAGRTKGLSDPHCKASAATNTGRKRGVGEAGVRNWRDAWGIGPSRFDLQMCQECGKVYRARQWRKLPKLGRPPKVRRRCPCGSTAWVSHHAAFPSALAEKCIIAGSSPKVCGNCGAPWKRIVSRASKGHPVRQSGEQSEARLSHGSGSADLAGAAYQRRKDRHPRRHLGWKQMCGCEVSDEGGRAVVLDPFAGMASTLIAAAALGRDSIGIEMSGEYCKLARARLRLAGVEVA
jgi:DNA modification methylase